MSHPTSPAEASHNYPEYIIEPIEVSGLTGTVIRNDNPDMILPTDDPDHFVQTADPDPIVENIHAIWPEDSLDPVPDTRSHQEFTDYAKSRFEPRFNGSEPTTITGVVTQPAKGRPRIDKDRDGKVRWIGDVTPRIAVGFLLASTVAANLLGNIVSLSADIDEGVRRALHNGKNAVSGWLGHKQPVKTETRATTTTGDEFAIIHNYPQPVGKSAPNEADIAHLVDEVKNAQNRGYDLTDIEVFAESSDEWSCSAESLQKYDAGNDKLDDLRANDAANKLTEQAEAAGVTLPEVKILTAEQLLGDSDVAELKALAAEHKLSLDQAICTFNRGGKLAPELKEKLQAKLGDERSVTIRINLREPFRTTLDTVQTPVVETGPKDQEHDYNFYPGFLPPFFPRLRRDEYLKTGLVSWERPGAKPDERWVELHKEALQEDGTLPRDAWRYSRKYQLLAREGRIDDVLIHRYTDDSGQEQDMRVLFVDHNPTEETLAMYKNVLNAVSQMNGGKVGKRWSAIAVFPTSQVGTHPNAGRTEDDDYPHHPADIGLGIDKQDPDTIAGYAAPSLGLVEMYMAENPTPKELTSYLGALWVSAHEFAGHATDTTGEPTLVIPVGPAGLRHYQTVSVWAHRGKEAFATTPNSDAPGPRELDATVRILTDEGEIVDITERVSALDGNDPRLRMSHTAVLHDRKPTKYAASSPGEFYSEIGAQSLSKILIPYREAGLPVKGAHRRLGRGYAVDPKLRQMFLDKTGWDPATARPVNENEFTFIQAEDDPMLRPFIDEARRTPMPDDRITILASVVGLENK
ncbi:MAG TPA: hypothetical protein VFB59_01415 [Candidatus Saccharimonadales bacterium]|nr:hypothetical protein [Candidatus Saccharimonadales bacterium]